MSSPHDIQAPPSVRCPIDDLVVQLCADGRPSLEWVVRWSQGGGDAVEAAWQAARNPDAMADLLDLAGLADAPELIAALVAEVDGWPHGLVAPGTDPRETEVLATRALVRLLRRAARPPTLAALLARPLGAHVARMYGQDLAQLVDDLETRRHPSLCWLVSAAMSGHDPVRVVWTGDARLAANVLALAAPEALASTLVALRDALGRLEASYRTGRSREFDGRGQNISAACAERLGQLVADLDAYGALGREAGPEARLASLGDVFATARHGGPGSDSFWELMTDAVCRQAREQRPSLRAVLAASALLGDAGFPG